MKKSLASRSAFFHPRALFGFAVCSVSALIALVAFAGDDPTTTAVTDNLDQVPHGKVVAKATAVQRTSSGMTPQVVIAAKSGESIALRDMRPAGEADIDLAQVKKSAIAMGGDGGAERVARPGAHRQSIDATLRQIGSRAAAIAAVGSVTPPPIGSFEGLADVDNAPAGLSLVNPPNTNADVGFAQIVEVVQDVFRVYDKTGTALTPVLKQSDLFESVGGQCSEKTPSAAQPIVLYDRIADRWLISQLNYAGSGDQAPFHQCMAVSKTSDATGEYYLYDFITPGSDFPQNRTLGVWPDGYYMSTRQFDSSTSAFNGVGAFAFDRQKMLVGDPSAQFVFFLVANDASFPSDASSVMLPSDHDGLLPPPAGAPNVFAIYDADEFGGTDSISLFNFHADFATPANSTFTARTESPVAVPAFDGRQPAGRADIEQPSPGENLDSNGDRLMYRLSYRNRGGVESLVTNHTVNVSGVDPTSAATYQAAPRYDELRKSTPAGAYSLYDGSAYSPDAGNGASGADRWVGSTAIDNQGNLAMGYSLSSTSVIPSIAYVGRAFDQLGASLTNEQTLFAGQGTQAAGSGNRWGDISSMSVDPVDDSTFWYANEYYPAGNTGFNWHTRIGSFKFPTSTAPAQGTLSGTMTACDSGAPLGEVLVKVTGGPSDGFSAATADDGTYTLHLAPGTYSVTASSSIRNCTASAAAMVTIADGGTATFNTCLAGTPNLILPEDDPTPATVSEGNGNGQIDKDECNKLNIDVQNAGCAPATNIVGTLSTTTPGVTITQPNSAYPDAAIDGVVTNTIPFAVTTSSAFVCGTPVDLTLTTTYPGGSDVQTLTLPSCQAATAQFSGTIESSDSQTTNGRLGRDGSPATCAGKTCPGPLGAGGRSYDTHTFVNAGGVDACAKVDLSSACGATIFVGAYLGSFNPADLCANYLGDAGSSSTQQHVEVTVPAGQTVVVVVMEANAGTTCAYSGTVSDLLSNTDGGGGPCPFPEIAVEQPAGTDIPDGGTVSFGNVSFGSSTDKVFTIKNTGSEDLTGLGITINGTNASDFSVTDEPTAPVAGPNGSTTFTVRFTPGAVGVREAALHITNNDPDETRFDLMLTGSGVNDAPVADDQSVTTDENQPKAITLTASDANNEALTFSVVSGPAHGTLSGTAPNLTFTPDTNYHGSDSFTFKANDGTVDSNVATVSITVVQIPGVQFGSSSYEVWENQGHVMLTLKRTGPKTEATTVHFETIAGTAEPGSDYTTKSGDVTFPANGTNTRTIRIPIINNQAPEGTEKFQVKLTAGSNALIGARGTATVRIVDFDGPAPTVQFSAATYQTLEKRDHVVLTVERSGDRHAAVKVHFATSDETAHAGSDYVATSGDVTFPAGGAATETINIPITNDHVPEPDKTFKVTLTPNANAALGPQKVATVTIIDRD